MDHVRLGVYLIQESPAILLVEYTREPPGAIRKRLHVLNLDAEHIARSGIFDLEWARDVMDASQVCILDIFRGIIVPNLATEPVDAFNLHDFVVRNGAIGRDYYNMKMTGLRVSLLALTDIPGG